MTALHDGEVAALARQAVDLLGEDIEVRIDPIPSADPYRWGPRSWVVRPHLDRARPLSIKVESGWSPARALGELMTRLAEFVEDTNWYWGVPYPVCPGHQHPAQVRVEGDEVELHCPDTGQTVRRIRPLAG